MQYTKKFITRPMHPPSEQGTFSGATLLITGSCIGAGMIGLPVVSAPAGLIPSTLAMILCYLFAVGSSLLLLEATLWFDRRVNLISLASFALGKGGMAITWGFFSFLFYCLFVAYIDGSSQLLSEAIFYLFGFALPRAAAIFISTSAIGIIVYAGTKCVHWIAKIFLFGLAFSYCALISLGLPNIKGEFLSHTNWPATLAAIPILLICFGSQNLIPTLIYYVKKNIRSMRRAIFLGNLIPFLVYFLWNFVILGMVSDTNIQGDNMVTDLLRNATQSDSVLFFAATFSFFAILTPFMTNTLAFVDFLKDGFKISSETKYDPLIYGLVLIPPAIFTLSYPNLFLKALGFAGGFADVILFGCLPSLIVWIGRTRKKAKGAYRAPGGKALPIAILLFSIGVLVLRH